MYICYSLCALKQHIINRWEVIIKKNIAGRNGKLAFDNLNLIGRMKFMRKKYLLWWGIGIILLLLMAAFIMACQGPDGGTGPAGPAGPTGPAGPAGVMAAATCSDCHNETTLVKARQVQYEASLHGAGFTFERNGTSCAACHTSEGFMVLIETGSTTLDAAVSDPSPVNCRTCHEIHSTYTENDWALRVTEPVDIALTGDTIDLGAGNLCATCHQPRTSYDVPVIGGGEVKITSTRFGPHHGPQSTMLFGLAGYGEYTGSSGHSLIKDTCTTCHMADAYGKQAGGHTWSMAYEYHGHEVPNVAGCQTCHSDIEDFDVNGAVTEIEALMEELNNLLLAEGLITESGSAVTGTYTSAQAGALWNYRTVALEDRSHGVHNPGYAKFLLETALDALK